MQQYSAAGRRVRSRVKPAGRAHSRTGGSVETFARLTDHVNRIASGPVLQDTSQAGRIAEVCEEMWRRKGKRLRSHLVYCCGEIVGVPPADLDLYAWAAEAVHTATLLHDDVIDEADMRRGAPSANRMYDNTLPVLSGDYLVSEVIHRLACKGAPELLKSLCLTLKELSAGECVQYGLKYRIPDEPSEYLETARLKTTSLFRWSALVGPTLAVSDHRDDIASFIDAFGLLFQISDDLLDVVGTHEKDRHSDLREGRLNYVTWNMVRANAGLERYVREIFNGRAVDLGLIRRFEVESALASQVLDEVRRELGRLADRATRALEPFADSPAAQALQELARLCATRSS